MSDTYKYETIKKHDDRQSKLGLKTLYTNVVTRQNPTLSGLQQLQKTRYFSGVDAEIYFGDIFIDDATNINFTVQQNSMPIFGYNSYTFDTCAQGSRYITGSFTINFTKSSYLYDVLNVLSKVATGSSILSDKTTNTKTVNNEGIASYVVSKSPRKPMWDKCFDIVLSYGNYKVFGDSGKSIDYSTMVALRGVYITGCMQDFGTSNDTGKNQGLGQLPISETYSFYARDIDYDANVDEYTNTEIESDDIIIKDTRLCYSYLDNSYHITGELRYDISTVSLLAIHICIKKDDTTQSATFNLESSITNFDISTPNENFCYDLLCGAYDDKTDVTIDISISYNKTDGVHYIGPISDVYSVPAYEKQTDKK